MVEEDEFRRRATKHGGPIPFIRLYNEAKYQREIAFHEQSMSQLGLVNVWLDDFVLSDHNHRWVNCYALRDTFHFSDECASIGIFRTIVSCVIRRIGLFRDALDKTRDMPRVLSLDFVPDPHWIRDSGGPLSIRKEYLDLDIDAAARHDPVTYSHITTMTQDELWECISHDIHKIDTESVADWRATIILSEELIATGEDIRVSRDRVLDHLKMIRDNRKSNYLTIVAIPFGTDLSILRGKFRVLFPFVIGDVEYFYIIENRSFDAVTISLAEELYRLRNFADMEVPSTYWLNFLCDIFQDPQTVLAINSRADTPASGARWELTLAEWETFSCEGCMPCELDVDWGELPKANMYDRFFTTREVIMWGLRGPRMEGPTAANPHPCIGMGDIHCRVVFLAPNGLPGVDDEVPTALCAQTDVVRVIPRILRDTLRLDHDDLYQARRDVAQKYGWTPLSGSGHGIDGEDRVVNVSGHLISMLLAAHFTPISMARYVLQVENNIQVHVGNRRALRKFTWYRDRGFLSEARLDDKDLILWHALADFTLGIDVYIAYAEDLGLEPMPTVRLQAELDSLYRRFGLQDYQPVLDETYVFDW
jgi:hypothetical protein